MNSETSPSSTYCIPDGFIWTIIRNFYLIVKSSGKKATFSVTYMCNGWQIRERSQNVISPYSSDWVCVQCVLSSLLVMEAYISHCLSLFLEVCNMVIREMKCKLWSWLVGNFFMLLSSIPDKSGIHISAAYRRYRTIFLMLSSVELVPETLRSEEILIFM